MEVEKINPVGRFGIRRSRRVTALLEERTMRVDARRNRERILAAARDVLVEQGPNAPLDAISAAAGLLPSGTSGSDARRMSPKITRISSTSSRSAVPGKRLTRCVIPPRAAHLSCPGSEASRTCLDSRGDRRSSTGRTMQIGGTSLIV